MTSKEEWMWERTTKTVMVSISFLHLGSSAGSMDRTE
jgi:hypothetical protein